MNRAEAIEPTAINTRHIVLAVMFVCLAVADSLVMHLSLAMGATELNPIVAHVLAFNEVGFWYLKGLIAVGAVAFFVLLSRKYPAQVGKILMAITIVVGIDLLWDSIGLVYLSMT
jgi:hypothetical protein